MRLLAPGGILAAADDDGGLGLDASLRFTPTQAGDHVVELAAVGSLAGAYLFQASADAPGNDLYVVTNGAALVLETGDQGFDTVLASVSYALAPGVTVERLATTAEGGKASLNLTGNEAAQSIFGNAGANVLDGKGGPDMLWGKAGKDLFAFSTALGNGNVDGLPDFNVRDDTIGLDDSVFGGLPLGSLARGAFVTGTAARQADDRIVFDPATGHLYFDADGVGGAAQIHFATLTAGLKLTAADFVVI